MRIENGVLEIVYEEDIVDGKFEIPEGVTSIGEYAFMGRITLKEISIPKEVTDIRTLCILGMYWFT